MKCTMIAKTASSNISFQTSLKWSILACLDVFDIQFCSVLPRFFMTFLFSFFHFIALIHAPIYHCPDATFTSFMIITWERNQKWFTGELCYMATASNFPFKFTLNNLMMHCLRPSYFSVFILSIFMLFASFNYYQHFTFMALWSHHDNELLLRAILKLSNFSECDRLGCLK